MSPAEISSAFENFHNKQILVIGDVMVDSYLWGKVERISPEAPVPIVNCSRRENRLGGAANVALNLLALEAKPFLCGFIGNDESGRLFIEMLQKLKLETKGIYTVPGRPTTVKTRVIGGNQQLIRVDEETDKPLAKADEPAFITHIEQLLNNNKFDAIIYQDYDKGVLTSNIINTITEIANKKNIPTLVDPKKRNFDQYNNVTFFKPNFKEFCEGLKLELSKSDTNALYEAANAFRKEKNIKYLMITLSEKGVFICDDHTFHVIPAEVRDIADVSGAGDTVISVASLCLSTNFKPYFIAYVSNMAGGLVCEKVGVVPIDKKHLESELF